MYKETSKIMFLKLEAKNDERKLRIFGCQWDLNQGPLILANWAIEVVYKYYPNMKIRLRSFWQENEGTFRVEIHQVLKLSCQYYCGGWACGANLTVV